MQRIDQKLQNDKIQNYYNFLRSQHRCNDRFGIEGSQTDYNYIETVKYITDYKPYRKFKQGTKITVLFLLYNPAQFEWIEEAVKSCLWQIIGIEINLELLFVVDSMDDNLRQYLYVLENKYRDYAYFHFLFNTGRLGYGASYNMGLTSAQGEYIFIQDYDDISHPERFQWAIRILTQNPNLLLVAFTPLTFDLKMDLEHNFGTIDYGHPAILNSPLHTLLDATLMRNSAGRPLIRLNPQTICIKRQIASEIQIREKYCMASHQISQMDRIFIFHCLLKYPLGIMQSDLCLYFARHHNKQTCPSICQKYGDDLTTQAFKELSDELLNSLPYNIFKELCEAKNELIKNAKNWVF